MDNPISKESSSSVDSKTGEEYLRYKEAGDRSFRSKQYKEALVQYTQAIQCLETNNIKENAHVLYSNRSATFLSLGYVFFEGIGWYSYTFIIPHSEIVSFLCRQQEKALADAEKCIELDNTWSKVKSEYIAL